MEQFDNSDPLIIAKVSVITEIIESAVERKFNEFLAAQNRRFREEDTMNIEEAATYLQLKKGSLYVMKCNEQIPYIKRGRSVMFSKKALDEWNTTGRPSNINIDALVDANLAAAAKLRKIRR